MERPRPRRRLELLGAPRSCLRSPPCLPGELGLRPAPSSSVVRRVRSWERLGHGREEGLRVEVLLGSFDGFMQNCDFQVDSFRAHLLEFLELQVSGVRDPPRSPPRVRRVAPSGREEGLSRAAEPRSLFLEPRFPPPQVPCPPPSPHFI